MHASCYDNKKRGKFKKISIKNMQKEKKQRIIFVFYCQTEWEKVKESFEETLERLEREIEGTRRE